MLKGEPPEASSQKPVANSQPPGDPASQGYAATSPAHTMSALLDATWRRYWKGSRGESTLYCNGQRVVQAIGKDVLVQDVDTDAIDKAIAAFEADGNAPGTVNRKLAALSRMLTFAIDRNWINRKPKIERKPEPSHRIRWFTPEEEAKFLATFHEFEWPDMADLMVFLIDTGIRLSESLGITWKDCMDGYARTWDTKGKAAYSVPITDRVKAMLDRRKAALPEDSHGPFQGILTRHIVSYRWDIVREHIGLKDDAQAIPHACRHTFASRLVQAGVELTVVQKLMGHRTLTMTLRYAHLANRNLTDAIKKMQIRVQGDGNSNI